MNTEVRDDPEVLSLAVDIVEMARDTVLSAADPRHALRLVRTHAEPLHVLVTDVVLPLMNGLQLAAEVQALRPEVKILLMSASHTKGIDDYRMQLGLRGLFLDKPFTVVALTGAVRSLLDDRALMPWQRVQWPHHSGSTTPMKPMRLSGWANLARTSTLVYRCESAWKWRLGLQRKTR